MAKIDAKTARVFVKALAEESEEFAHTDISDAMIQRALERMQRATPEAERFRSLAMRYGFESTDLGRTFVSRGTEYRITGLNPSAPKFPVQGERVRDGQPFKFPEAVVKTGLGKKAFA